MSDVNLRVAVLGAGVLGSATALALIRRGCRVSLIDAAHPGAGTSGTTFGWVNSNNKSPRAYHELNVAGMAAHRRLAQEGKAPWLFLTGHLRWAGNPEQQKALDERDERLRAWGYPVNRLAGRHVMKQLEPDLRLPPDAEVSFYPDEGFVLPHLLLGNLLGAGREAGVELQTGSPVVGFGRKGGRISAVVLADGRRVLADRVIACCGRWTADVANMAGGVVPMEDAASGGSPALGLGLGLLGYTSPLTARLDRVVTSPDLQARPDGGGRLILNALDVDARVAPDLVPDVRSDVAADLLRRVAGLFGPLSGVRLEALRLGIRSMPADGLTVAGEVPETGGLYVLATHSGITLAPLLSELVAREIAEDAAEGILDSFRPDRFVSHRLAPTH